MSSTLGRMALNDEGFMFDPQTGESFVVNRTGRFLIDGLKEGNEPEALARRLAEHWSIDEETARRDVQDFIEQLRLLRLIA